MRKTEKPEDLGFSVGGNIKMDLQEIERGSANWIALA